MYDHPSHGVLARLTVPGMVLSCGVGLKLKQKVTVTPGNLCHLHQWASLARLVIIGAHGVDCQVSPPILIHFMQKKRNIS